MTLTRCLIPVLVLLVQANVMAQSIDWADDGNSYYQIEHNSIIKYTLPANTPTPILDGNKLNSGGNSPLQIRRFYFNKDQTMALLYTNTRRVWRLDTRGDYWLYEFSSKKLRQLGTKLPSSSLMFAKFSPDGKQVGYVSQHNVFVEDCVSGDIKMLTKDGSRKLINGTFDWAYEEEFYCRDGFQWSPDGRHIAFWQVDATKIPDFNMINNTDSVYSSVIPVEYPTAGQDPSPVKIGVASIIDGSISWLNIPGDPQQHYLPRLEWNTAKEVFVQQLNRKQNTSVIYGCPIDGAGCKSVYTEKDEAWVDVYSDWDDPYSLEFRHRFIWLNGGKEFLWVSEKDGWRHIYRITKDGKETLVTKGDFDIIDINHVDEKNNVIYFTASPTNATQKYLFRTKLDGKGKLEQVSPAALKGTHNYDLSPTGKFGIHNFTNAYTRPLVELISLPAHKAIKESESIAADLATAEEPKRIEFFKIKTSEGVEMDGWVVKPDNFDATKKYPIVFLVYTEPAGANVVDRYATGRNGLYNGDMAKDGYIYASIDNRGTPAPKGRAWRKSIYKKIGRLNISDQALAAQEVLKWPYVDRERVAVWGWSGGGSATLNLMFQYPDIYKTGIAVAAVANQLTYDNIYQERYMGLPQENLEDFIAGSPLTYAKNLKGKLLYIHGTGDDNVHYSNAEMLLNALVKYNKQFEFMAYPNRTHGISEGEGTNRHLTTLYTEFLRKNCPPGAR